MPLKQISKKALTASMPTKVPKQLVRNMAYQVSLFWRTGCLVRSSNMQDNAEIENINYQFSILIVIREGAKYFGY